MSLLPVRKPLILIAYTSSMCVVSCSPRLSARPGDAGVQGWQAGRDLLSIFGHHRGTQQTQAETEALIEAFRRNISSGSLYQRKCIDCHDRACDFARIRLVIVQGVLKGRYSGYVVEDFLRGHGRLNGSEVAQMVATLKWQLETREP